MAKCGYEVDDRGVATLKINNPPLNAFDDQTLMDLRDAVKKIASDDKVKVVVVTGEGPAFVVGADIKKIKEVNTSEEIIRVTEQAHEIFNMIEKSRKPYIAAVNGLALGGGTELALACHMRIGGDQAQMGLPEINLGILPGFGGTQRSARLLGTARALEMMLTGKFIDMKEADKIGLVNRVVPHADVLSETQKIARSIANKGQVAVRAVVEAVMEGSRLSQEEGLRLERQLLGKLAETEDKKEGINAFLEKRKPVFKNR